MSFQPYNYQPAYNPYASSMPFPPRQDYVGTQGCIQQSNLVNASLQNQQSFSCRPVTSREEAVAAQIDFMGPGTIMPDLGHGMIYLKRFNPNTGSSDFLLFTLQSQDQEKTDQTVAFASLQDLTDLKDTVNRLEDEIERLKKTNQGKAGKKNDADE